MPANEQDEQVDTTETVPLSPEWGGVPVHGGDNADATGGAPSEAEPIEIDADEDAAPAAEADDAAADAESDEGGDSEAEAVEAPAGADA
jgi:hypothetical protein